MSSAFSSCLRSRDGTTSLEFAVIGGIFMLLMLGAFQLGIYLFTVQGLELLTGMVARAAIVGTVSPACPATLPSSVPIPPILAPAQLSVCVVKTNPSGDIQIQVTSTYQFAFFLPIMASDSGPVSQKTVPLY
jgi:Flp pilus assembly pilin Flp